MFLPVVDSASGVVDPFVRVVSASVLKSVLDGGNSEHEGNWDHGDLFAKGVDGREPVEQHDEQKVKVGHSVELLEQVLGQERQHSVLGGPDFVAREHVIRMLRGWRVHRHSVVRNHHPHLPSDVILPAPPPEVQLSNTNLDKFQIMATVLVE